MPTARGWVAPKRWRSSASRKPSGDAAIERAAGGEGDEQALGAIGIADGGARLGADLAEPLLERGDAAGDFGIDHDRVGRALGLDLRRRAGAAARRPAGRLRRGLRPARPARCRWRGRRRPNWRADSPSRRARAGRREPGIEQGPQRRNGGARPRRRNRPVRNRRSSGARLISPSTLAQLGGEGQQGVVARLGGDMRPRPSLRRPRPRSAR